MVVDVILETVKLYGMLLILRNQSFLVFKTLGAVMSRCFKGVTRRLKKGPSNSLALYLVSIPSIICLVGIAAAPHTNDSNQSKENSTKVAMQLAVPGGRGSEAAKCCKRRSGGAVGLLRYCVLASCPKRRVSSAVIAPYSKA